MKGEVFFKKKPAKRNKPFLTSDLRNMASSTRAATRQQQLAEEKTRTQEFVAELIQSARSHRRFKPVEVLGQGTCTSYFFKKILSCPAAQPHGVCESGVSRAPSSSATVLSACGTRLFFARWRRECCHRPLRDLCAASCGRGESWRGCPPLLSLFNTVVQTRRRCHARLRRALSRANQTNVFAILQTAKCTARWILTIYRDVSFFIYILASRHLLWVLWWFWKVLDEPTVGGAEG